MMKCPSCRVPLCRIEYEGVPIHICPDCQGSLVEDPRLDQVRKRRERVWSEQEVRRIAAEAGGHDTPGRVRCPMCLAWMEKVRAAWNDTAFHLDRCAKCKVTWLDKGELDLLQIQYEKEVADRTPEDWDRIERGAVAEMQLKTQLAEEDYEELRSLNATLTNVELWGPPVIAAAVGLWASRNLVEALSEPHPQERRPQLVMAAIGVAVLIAMVLLCYWLGWWFW